MIPFRCLLIAKLAPFLLIPALIANASEDAQLDVKIEDGTAEGIVEVARPLLGLRSGENSNDHISITTNPSGTHISATGTEQTIECLRELIQLVNFPVRKPASTEAPEIRDYLISSKIDHSNCFQVLKTLTAGQADLRLAIDPKTNRLVAMAPPETHQLIAVVLVKLAAESIVEEDDANPGLVEGAGPATSARRIRPRLQRCQRTLAIRRRRWGY
jgi:type II secretory pathway component GspD/PulD (secretin)